STMAISVILSRLACPPVVSISTMAYRRSFPMRSRAFLHLAGLLISGFFVMCQVSAQRPRAAAADGPPAIRPGAWQMDLYLPMLEGRAVALVVNQTSIVGRTHLIDTLLTRGVRVVK